MFTRIQVEGWRQFRNVDINFHPRLTILTGANGAGKTTLLSLISRHLGWSTPYLSTFVGRNSKGLSYSVDTWAPGRLYEAGKNLLLNAEDGWDEGAQIENSVSDDEIIEKAADILRQRKIAESLRYQGNMVNVGSITYENGATARLQIQADVNQQLYEITIANQQSVEGVHIASHRSMYSYQQLQNIPTVARKKQDAFQGYLNIFRARLSGSHTQWSPQYYMKETLVGLAFFGYGNEASGRDEEAIKLFEDFQRVLKILLPPAMGFKRILIRVPEVLLDTETGIFPIDALSGGSSAIVDLAWQIFMFQPSGQRYVVTLDEPENHLHPELQRSVVRDLVRAFPNVQFVVATHSPFVVGSVPDSYVYVLRFNEREVVSELLEDANKAGSANEILREVLGVDTTLPIWATEEIDKLVQKYSHLGLDKGTLAEFKSDLTALGMENQIPQAVASLFSIKDRQ